jgi:hypothetical protein
LAFTRIPFHAALAADRRPGIPLTFNAPVGTWFGIAQVEPDFNGVFGDRPKWLTRRERLASPPIDNSVSQHFG